MTRRPLTDSEMTRVIEGTKIPPALPGWRVVPMDGASINRPALAKDFANGLRALYSIDPYAAWSDSEREDGWWRHLSISRKDRDPKWEEMRDLVYSCGYFDPTRSVRMVLPSQDEYVGEMGTGPRHVGKELNPHVFHWWQPDR